RISRVPLGVDVTTFTPERRERAAEVRRRHGLPVDGPLVVFLGRLAAEKSLDVAIDGWRRFDPQKRATFLITGYGPLLEELRARADGASIRFQPFVNDRDDVADLLAAADVYLAPSAVETFGLSALEALACGTPLVSADRGGVAEHVRRSGAGTLFTAGNAESLANALRACLDRSRDEVGRRARDFVLREHDWDTVFDQIFDVYRTAAVQ
ncbi:MAG TPA: glycosyltransferase, partial [Gemmatimonadaceae bacterium]